MIRLLICTTLAAVVCVLLEEFGSTAFASNPGRPFEITSLADSGRGSLREALARGNNRRIIFKVAGTIKLQSALKIKGQSFITIDGSTSPDPGITLENYGFIIGVRTMSP
jgi:hypothetical protein